MDLGFIALPMVNFMCTYWRARRAHFCLRDRRCCHGQSCYSDHHSFAHLFPSLRKALSLLQAPPSPSLPGCILFTTSSFLKAGSPKSTSSRKPHVKPIRSQLLLWTSTWHFLSLSYSHHHFFFPFCIIFIVVAPQTSSNVLLLRMIQRRLNEWANKLIHEFQMVDSGCSWLEASAFITFFLLLQD